MLIYIIFGISTIAIFISLIVENRNKKKRIQLETNQLVSYISDFSVSKYMGRIEKYGIEIMSERQKETNYQIILWIGIDGLRLNDDGTTEWIRREKETEKPISISYSQCQSMNWNAMQLPYSECQQSTINQLEAQNHMLQMQIQMNIQSANAIYPTYIQNPYYYRNIQQCCAIPLYNQGCY